MQVKSEELSSLQGSLTLSYTESSKRLHKDQHKTWPKFWCGKNIYKKLQYDKCNFRGVIAFTRSFDLGYIESLKMLHKGQHHTWLKFWWKVTTWCRQILRHYHIHKELQHTAIWPWPSSKDQKGQTKINIKVVRFWCGEYHCTVTTWWM